MRGFSIFLHNQKLSRFCLISQQVEFRFTYAITPIMIPTWIQFVTGSSVKARTTEMAATNRRIPTRTLLTCFQIFFQQSFLLFGRHLVRAVNRQPLGSLGSRQTFLSNVVRNAQLLEAFFLGQCMPMNLRGCLDFFCHFLFVLFGLLRQEG